MSLIQSLRETFSVGSSAGIYWDGASFGMVQVSGSARSLEIDRASSTYLKDGVDVATVIKETISREGFRYDRLVSAVPASSATIRELPLPFTDLKKLRKTLKFQVEPYVTLPADEIIADCVTPFHDGKFISVALQKRFLTEHLDTLQRAGLSPDLTGVGEISLFYLYLALRSRSHPEATAIVHVRQNRTGVQIVKNGVLELVRAIEGPPINISSIVQTLRIWNLAANGDTLKQVLVVSPFAEREKVVETISQAVVTDTALWEPFEELNRKSVSLSAEQQSDLCIPFGLAVMGILGTTQTLNLRKEEYLKSKGRGLKVHILILLLSLLAMLSLAFTNIFHRLDEYQAQYDRLGRSIVQIFQDSFPGSARPLRGRELSQMRQKVAEEASQYRWAQEVLSGKVALDTILSLSSILSAYPEIIMDQMTIEERRLSFGGHTNSFSSVDRLKEALARNASFTNARLTGTKMDKKDNSIAFQFALEAAP